MGGKLERQPGGPGKIFPMIKKPGGTKFLGKILLANFTPFLSHKKIAILKCGVCCYHIFTLEILEHSRVARIYSFVHLFMKNLLLRSLSPANSRLKFPESEYRRMGATLFCCVLQALLVINILFQFLLRNRTISPGGWRRKQ